MGSSFNIDDFRVSQDFKPAKVKRTRRWFREEELFVPGPIPVRLLSHFKVPVALRVWLALHTRLRMGLSSRLSEDFFENFGLSKQLSQRGLKELEGLGLVEVTRKNGRAAEAKLLDVPPTQAAP